MGTVDGALVHALDDGRAGAEGAEEIQHERLAPAMGELPSQDLLLVLREDVDVLEGAVLVADLGDEGAPLEDFAMLGQAALLEEDVDVGEDLLAGVADERVVQQGANGGTGAASFAILLVRGGGRSGVVGAAAAAGAAERIVARVVVCEVGVRGLIVDPWGRHGEVIPVGVRTLGSAGCVLKGIVTGEGPGDPLFDEEGMKGKRFTRTLKREGGCFKEVDAPGIDQGRRAYSNGAGAQRTYLVEHGEVDRIPQDKKARDVRIQDAGHGAWGVVDAGEGCSCDDIVTLEDVKTVQFSVRR